MKITKPPKVIDLPDQAQVPPHVPVVEDTAITLPIGAVKRLKIRIYEDELLTKELSGVLVELVHNDTNLTFRLDASRVELSSVWVVVTTDKHQIITEVEKGD